MYSVSSYNIPTFLRLREQGSLSTTAPTATMFGCFAPCDCVSSPTVQRCYLCDACTLTHERVCCKRPNPETMGIIHETTGDTWCARCFDLHCDPLPTEALGGSSRDTLQALQSSHGRDDDGSDHYDSDSSSSDEREESSDDEDHSPKRRRVGDFEFLNSSDDEDVEE